MSESGRQEALDYGFQLIPTGHLKRPPPVHRFVHWASSVQISLHSEVPSGSEFLEKTIQQSAIIMT